MSNANRLFFIALLPPPDIQAAVTAIKQEFAARYGSQQALKSPPHITLQPPFQWAWAEVKTLQHCLAEFASDQAPVPITLSGFGAFPPRVIYVHPLKTAELLALYRDLQACLEANLNLADPLAKHRSFAPHMTVAFRDLTRQNFRAAWPEFQGRSLHCEFTVRQLTLLLHNGQRWTVYRDFPFSNPGQEPML